VVRQESKRLWLTRRRGVGDRGGMLVRCLEAPSAALGARLEAISGEPGLETTPSATSKKGIDLAPEQAVNTLGCSSGEACPGCLGAASPAKLRRAATMRGVCTGVPWTCCTGSRGS